jgi:tetratricopeptide (TPR) repeat protein
LSSGIADKERAVIRTVFAAAVCVWLVSPGAADAAAKCQIAQVAELPITMMNLRPTIVAQINGKDARFLVDSGAFYSMMSSATAAQYNLRTQPGPFGLKVIGVGGSQDAELAKVKEFKLIGVPIKDIEFLVGGSELDKDIVGLLGQNILEIFDVEYDLGHGAIRLFKTKDCEKARLAYWLTENQGFSQMPIDEVTPQHSHTLGVAYVNGKRIKIAFDSGASRSVLSIDAAARAGVKVDSEGVKVVGYSKGLGRGMVKTYVARFDTFKIGDGEEIKNARLPIAKIDLGLADMLLGADFFISHRIFVGNRERQLFLSYSGGPVFDLSKPMDSPPADDNEDSVTANAPAGEGDTDTSAVARRAAALIARHDYATGIPLLSKAITLTPNDPEFYYQRANAYAANNQGDLALADYDQVIKLKQDFLPAYIPRAELRLAKSNKAEALVDLESVDRLAPKPADLRFALAELYERLDQWPEAVKQYDLWIDNHPDDSRMVKALGSRCFSRAIENQELPRAIKDCDKALWRGDKSTPGYSELWVYRAIARIRMGDYDKAIADCNDALKLSPKNANAFYIRAVAESKKNKKAESDADLASARAIAPKIGMRLARFGVAP